MMTRPFFILSLVLLPLLAACSGPQSRPEPAPVSQAEPVIPAELPPPAAGTPAVPPAPVDTWQALQNGFALGESGQPRVRQSIRRYSKSPHDIETVLARGAPWLGWILGEVVERGYPVEIALLPFVESGFDPLAYSHGRAAGMWQFIPATGRIYGLGQDWWYDGRRDAIASTRAALDYLGYLHGQFDGDWLLALAAYNSGSGTVRKAVRRNRKAGKPTDFWHLRLPKETSVYVPRLLAISHIVSRPQEFGVDLPALPPQPAFAIVETGGQLDLAVAAELAGTDTDTLYQLNPGFNRWATHPDGPHRLVVPAQARQQFIAGLANLPVDKRTRWTRHRIRHGETLSHIAKRYDTTIAVLKTTNNLDGNRIRSGSYLLIPVAARDSGQYAALQKLAGGHGNRTTYTIRNGDSLWKIARQHDVTVRQIVRWNRLDNGSAIQPGQTLVIRNGPSGSRTRSIHYTVRSGDSLYAISRKFNVTIADLKRWNRLDGRKYLRPGQKLRLHVDITRVSQG